MVIFSSLRRPLIFILYINLGVFKILRLFKNNEIHLDNDNSYYLI